MAIEAKKPHLSDLVHFHPGYPFRGSIEEVGDGGVLAVQMKDVDPDKGVNWLGVTRTVLPGRKQPEWLKPGDILFAFRGVRFYAVCLDATPSAAVCSPHFFHLRVKSPAITLPAFFAWQMNQPPVQRLLQQAAEGSSQLSVRRPVFEALPFSVPSLEDQHRIVALAKLAKRERSFMHQLIRNREQQLKALAEDLA